MCIFFVTAVKEDNDFVCCARFTPTHSVLMNSVHMYLLYAIFYFTDKVNYGVDLNEATSHDFSYSLNVIVFGILKHYQHMPQL